MLQWLWQSLLRWPRFIPIVSNQHVVEDLDANIEEEEDLTLVTKLLEFPNEDMEEETNVVEVPRKEMEEENSSHYK